MTINKKSILGLLAVVSILCFNFSFLKDEKLAKGKWVSLFDGKTLNGWKCYLKETIPAAWQVEDGAIVLNGKDAGDLITVKEYGNFELEIEWKISEGGNSGVIYHVHEDPKYQATYLTGPEMQVLDDQRHPDAKKGKEGNHKAGSLYDMLPPSDTTVCKPAGQWNKARLVVNNGKAEHYLNGKKIVSYETTGASWSALVSASKFKAWEGFNKYPVGHIALQDHGDKVWYRNIRLREL